MGEDMIVRWLITLSLLVGLLLICILYLAEKIK